MITGARVGVKIGLCTQKGAVLGGGQYKNYVQGDPKKMSVSVLKLKSVPEVRFYFPACVLDSEF